MAFWNNGRDAANKGHKGVDTKGMQTQERERTVAAFKNQQNKNNQK